jgi:hypothetical protein
LTKEHNLLIAIHAAGSGFISLYDRLPFASKIKVALDLHKVDVQPRKLGW